MLTTSLVSRRSFQNDPHKARHRESQKWPRQSHTRRPGHHQSPNSHSGPHSPFGGGSANEFGFIRCRTHSYRLMRDAAVVGLHHPCGSPLPRAAGLAHCRRSPVSRHRFFFALLPHALDAPFVHGLPSVVHLNRARHALPRYPPPRHGRPFSSGTLRPVRPRGAHEHHHRRHLRRPRHRRARRVRAHECVV
jgi:hypothetical protein